jgi:hypothetical protein
MGPEAAIWLALIPCAILTVTALLLLGAPLGRLLYGGNVPFHFWHPEELHPEPTEQGRYVIALAAPLLLSGATAWLARRPSLHPRRQRAVAMLAQLGLLAFVIACWVGQHMSVITIHAYFSEATLVTAGLLVAIAVALLANDRAREACAAVVRETRVRRWGALLAALVFTAVWMLHALNTDNSIGWANAITSYHVQFPFDEAFAVVNGLTPLVDFDAQYSSLWPYLSALSLTLFGKTLLVFTIAMASVTGIAMLAIFGVLRRVARSSVAALALYLPFVSTSFFMVFGSWYSRHTFGSYFPSFPLRYGGPYLLAWLIARRLDRDGNVRSWPLFAAAGLVLVNNTEFGIAALGATIAAGIWTMRPPSRSALFALGVRVAGGLALAVVLVSALTLARAGTLPHLERAAEFSRLYLVGGFALIKMPHVIGLHLVVYATFVAAIGVATVLALRGASRPTLIGMLVWSGVFGLGAASYYAGRSGDDTLPMMFSAWALALALLTIVAVRRLAAGGARRPALALLLVLYGMGVTAGSVAQTPMPWTQLARLRHPPPDTAAGQPEQYVPIPGERDAIAAVADGPRRFVYRRGAPIALLMTTGHRMADAYHVRDVTPYTGIESIFTVEQFERVLDALAEAGGNTLVMPPFSAVPAYRQLTRRGFAIATERGLQKWTPRMGTTLPASGTYIRWVDTTRLRMPADQP